MKKRIYPNEEEIEFLNLAYNKFYDIFEEAFQDKFWEKPPEYRFLKIKQVFEIYSELLNYEPLKTVLEIIKVKRPPMEAEIGSNLFKTIRNILTHYPFFETWNDVWVNKKLVNWYRKGQSIDYFFRKYAGKPTVKYRIWEEDKKKMTYISINFPKEYSNEKIYLKDILTEYEGIKFSLILMKNILDTQVEK